MTEAFRKKLGEITCESCELRGLSDDDFARITRGERPGALATTMVGAVEEGVKARDHVVAESTLAANELGDTRVLSQLADVARTSAESALVGSLGEEGIDVSGVAANPAKQDRVLSAAKGCLGAKIAQVCQGSGSHMISSLGGRLAYVVARYGTEEEELLAGMGLRACEQSGVHGSPQESLARHAEVLTMLREM